MNQFMEKWIEDIIYFTAELKILTECLKQIINIDQH